MRLNRSAFFLYLLLSLALAACTSSDLPVLRYGTPAEAGMSADSLEAAVELYRSAVEADDLRGVVVLVARRGIVGERPQTAGCAWIRADARGSDGGVR